MIDFCKTSHRKNQIRSDQICAACGIWAKSESDFMEDFIFCTKCPQSFHEECVSQCGSPEDIKQKCNCIDVMNLRTNDLYNCTEPRDARLLFRIVTNGDNQVHHNNDGTTFFNYTKHPSIKWKEQSYEVGHCIKIRNAFGSGFEDKIGMIKEIFVYDEAQKVPSCSILWFWKEREVCNFLLESLHKNAKDYSQAFSKMLVNIVVRKS